MGKNCDTCNFVMYTATYNSLNYSTAFSPRSSFTNAPEHKNTPKRQGEQQSLKTPPQ